MPAIPDFTQPGWNKALEGRWLRANHQLTFASPSDWGYKNALRDMNDVMATVKAGAMGAQVEKPTPQPQPQPQPKPQPSRSHSRSPTWVYKGPMVRWNLGT